ncbi:MAG: hypothetical protein R3F30_12385 [Planctomycetota bacterium]
MFLRTPLSVLALAACLSAQTTLPFPDNLPGSGGCNVIPFGNTASSLSTWGNQKYQTILTAAQIGTIPRVIAEISFPPCGTGTRLFKTIKIQLGYSSSATLSTTFASNLTNPVTVLDATDYAWPQVANQWCRIGLQKDFTYIPTLGNLVIDIEVTGAQLVSGTAGFRSATSPALPRMYKYGWTTPPTTGTSGTSSGIKWELLIDAADLSVYGIGCQGSNGVPALAFTGTAQLNTVFSVDLSGAPASKAAILILGANNLKPLPVDLGIIGAKGCWLYVSLDLLFGVPTDASGNASVRFPIPNDRSLVRNRVYFQYAPIDATANNLGLTTSNYGRVLIGY